jgi:serine protease inhibitor
MKTNLLAVLLVTFTLVACKGPQKDSTPTPTPAPPSVKTAGKLMETTKPNETEFQLYRMLAASPNNINFSPLSLKIAFSLIYPGTAGDTQKLYEKIFGFSTANLNPFAAEYALATKTENLKSDTNQLIIANSAWLKNPKSVKSEFANSLQTQNAEIDKLNLEAINAWVAKATRNKIPKLLNSLDPSTRAVFINAIYFKQKWLAPFDAKSTTTDIFQTSLQASSRVPTMHTQKEVNYFEDKTSKWVGLNYADSPFQMLFALPMERFQLKAVEDSLSAEEISTLLDQMKPVQVQLSIPKFKFNEMASLKEILTNAGYGELFSDGNYSGISGQSSVLSDVIQAASIEVNETGTEASAATGTVMLRNLRMKEPIFQKSFIADQPFLFVLLNKETKEIYWLGRVYQPTLNK